MLDDFHEFQFCADENHYPEFLGAPYEFWVGNDAPIGTSIGQIRVVGNVEKDKIIYDLLHGYHEGGKTINFCRMCFSEILEKNVLSLLLK